MCGTYGIYRTGLIEYHDEDWYRLGIAAHTVLDVLVEADGRAQLAIFGGTCDHPAVLCDQVADVCGTAHCQTLLTPGTYIVLVRPALFSQVVPCGSRYRLEIRGQTCPILATAPGRWALVKSLYR